MELKKFKDSIGYSKDIFYYPKTIINPNSKIYKKYVTIQWRKVWPKGRTGQQRIMGNGPELAEALEKQEFIATQISSGDSVTLRLNEGRYDIICHNTVIGSMSDSYNRELQSTFNDNCRYISQLPSVIDKLYIANVFTFVAYREYENIPAHFRQNRFWLAVEITGFGRTIWQENT